MKVANGTLIQAEAQKVAGYVGLGTLVIASVGLAKLQGDFIVLKKEQAERADRLAEEAAPVYDHKGGVLEEKAAGVGVRPSESHAAVDEAV